MPAPPDRCFDLSLSVDAHVASMGQAGERAVGGVTSGVMNAGDEVTWEARHFGRWFTMTSRISEYDRPYRFVDEQVAGPFNCWWHEHHFDPDGTSTVMTDIVVFESPAGILGRLGNRLYLTRYMTGLLVRRNAWLRSAIVRH